MENEGLQLTFAHQCTCAKLPLHEMDTASLKSSALTLTAHHHFLGEIQCQPSDRHVLRLIIPRVLSALLY